MATNNETVLLSLLITDDVLGEYTAIVTVTHNSVQRALARVLINYFQLELIGLNYLEIDCPKTRAHIQSLLEEKIKSIRLIRIPDNENIPPIESDLDDIKDYYWAYAQKSAGLISIFQHYNQIKTQQS